MTISSSDFDADLSAQLLLKARKTKRLLVSLPDAALPCSEAQADLVQDKVAHLMGPVSAWKVGAATPLSTPSRAPIHAETLFINPGRVEAGMFSCVGVEAEIAYKFNKDLNTSGRDLTLDEVLSAVESVHPAIEIVDTRFLSWNSQPPFAHRADQGNHGALIVGEAIENWRSMKPQEQRVVLQVDGKIVGDEIDGNTGGNPERLLLWLANVGAQSLGGIKAGQYVTTGSCAGMVMVKAPVEVKASLFGRGEVRLVVA